MNLNAAITATKTQKRRGYSVVGTKDALAFVGASFIFWISMKRITGAGLLAVALFVTAPVFAGEKNDHACCATGASNGSKKMCANFASLGVNAEQKAKLEAWEADCLKAGCTKESRAKFLQRAQGILSADQYAKLKSECDASAAKQTGA